jgi:hypothetical protein
MKRLFLYLLKKYSKRENGRKIIYEQLWDSVINEYNEQTSYGNIYNINIEFIMFNPFIKKEVLFKDNVSLKMIKANLAESYNKALIYIEEENQNK